MTTYTDKELEQKIYDVVHEMGLEKSLDELLDFWEEAEVDRISELDDKEILEYIGEEE